MQLVQQNSRDYWEWPSLPVDNKILALVPDEARRLCAEYERLRARFAECLQIVRDSEERSAAMAAARQKDLQATNEAVRSGRPGPPPEHAPRLRVQREAAQQEVLALAAVANEVLTALEEVLAQAQPAIVKQAYDEMNEVLGDRKKSWRDKLNATAILSWAVDLPATLTPQRVEVVEYERAEALLTEGPSLAARRVVEQMPEVLRRPLAKATA
jgi:hypothetical protein